MKKNKTINALEEAIKKIKDLKKEHAYSSEHTRWIFNTTGLLEDIFGKSSEICGAFSHMNWTFKGAFIASPWDYEETMETKNKEAYSEALDAAEGILRSGIDLIKRKGIENVYEPEKSAETVKIISLLDSKLRKLIREKPTKERNILDAIENLFIGAGLDKDFSREKIKIPYSSKAYIPDFVFEKISTVVEVKFCDTQKREKEIIGEINDDILAYKTKYANLIFVIYDMSIIRDQDQFKEGIEEQENVILRIIKH